MAVGDLTATIGSSADKNSAFFDGVDDFISIPHDPSFLGVNLPDGLTVCAWVRALSKGETNQGRIFDKSNSSTAGIGLRFGTDGNGAIAVRINAGTGAASANSAIFGASLKWVHCLATVTAAGVVNIYADGTLSGSADQDGGQALSTITNTNVANIGSRSLATDVTWFGFIKDVRFYNKILTTAEITKLANNEHVSRGLIGHWELKGNANDSGPKGLDGTVTGAIFTHESPGNKIQVDFAGHNTTSAGDPVIAVPIPGRDAGVRVFSVKRATS